MRPRLGFLGVGWIGRARLEALVAAEAGEVVAIADPSPEARAAAQTLAPEARPLARADDLYDLALDGVVIATPSAEHAGQALRALERGLPVFVQKPLGRTADEVRRVVEAARRADRRLGLDMSYRETAALRAVAELVHGGALGAPFAVELVFHNAYGPDKAWFYDRARSGGGCVMDLGVHLVDAALHLLGFPEVTGVHARLFAGGRRLAPGEDAVEDYAAVQLDLAGGATAQLACSWRLAAGADAVIAARVYGSEGGAEMRNVNGSFYDFVAARHRGTQREPIAEPPDAWGGRALVRWAHAIADSPRYDAEAGRFVAVAEVLDRIYGGDRARAA